MNPITIFINSISKLVDFQQILNKNGLSHFVSHDMAPDFNYKPHVKRYSSFFLKYGFRVPMAFGEYCGRMSGIKSDLYIPRNLAFCYIYPYLAKYSFCPAYADKNVERKLLNITQLQNMTELSLPVEVVYNMNGVYFNNNDEEISEQEAANILSSYANDIIIKPSIGTYGGTDVNRIRYADHSTLKQCLALFHKYKKDFQIQQIIIQHPDMASFNPSSVNTVRIVTYRRPNKERKVLYAILRFGSEGAIKDNVCAGGGFCALNMDGSLKDRIKHVYKTQKLDRISENCVNIIPCFDKITKAALALHGQLPHFDIMGWDFAVSSNEHPVLIEYNIRPGVGIQQAVGPMFSKEDLEEIMPEIKKFNSGFELLPYVDYPQKKGFKSNWKK